MHGSNMYKKLFLNFHSNRWSNQIFWSEIKWRFPGSGIPHFFSLIYKNQILLFVIVEWHFFLRKNSIRSFFSIMMAFFNESHLFDMVSSHANIKGRIIRLMIHRSQINWSEVLKIFFPVRRHNIISDFFFKNGHQISNYYH